MILGVKASGSYEYFDGLRDRLMNPEGLGVTLTGRVWHVKGLWVVKAEPQLPEFWKYGVVALIGAHFLQEVIGWWSLFASIPGIIMLFTGVFWMKTFYKLVIRLGLRRHYGRHHKIDSFLYGNKLLEAVLNGTR